MNDKHNSKNLQNFFRVYEMNIKKNSKMYFKRHKESTEKSRIKFKWDKKYSEKIYRGQTHYR